MFTSLTSRFRTLLPCLKYQASFYKTVTFFEQLQSTPGSIEKEKHINNFRGGLEQQDLRQFQNLMGHINSKVKIGITTKVVNSHFVKKFVSQSQHQAVLEEIANGGLANRICVLDQESQLTLYDVNLFLKYIAGVSGSGSQKQKSQKIIQVVEKVSKKQGLYILKLIDHKITIGAKGKTFKKAKIIKGKGDKQA